MARSEQKRDAEAKKRLGIAPATAGALAYAGGPTYMSPLTDIAGALFQAMRSGKGIDAPTGTPLQEIAELSREEVASIVDFAKRQGVAVPILAGSPARYEFPTIVGKMIDRMPAVREQLASRGVEAAVPRIYLSTTSVPAAMHEIGHATPVLGRALPTALWQTLVNASERLPGGILRGALLGNVLLPPEEDAGPVRQFAYEHAPGLVAASKVPLVAEEARASLHALRGAHKLGPGIAPALKELAPALGTYVAHAAVPAIATLLARKVVEALHGRAQEKSAAVLGQEVKAPGALRQSASAAWQQTSPPKPKTTQPSTNPSNRAKAPATAQPPSKTGFYRDMLQSLYNPQRGSRLTVPPKL